jgi:hypothetical protein
VPIGRRQPDVHPTSSATRSPPKPSTGMRLEAIAALLRHRSMHDPHLRPHRRPCRR